MRQLDDDLNYPLLPTTEQIVRWFVTEHPSLVEALLGEITRMLRTELDMPDAAIAEALRDAVVLQSDDYDATEALRRRVMPPSLSQQS